MKQLVALLALALLLTTATAQDNHTFRGTGVVQTQPINITQSPWTITYNHATDLFQLFVFNAVEPRKCFFESGHIELKGRTLVLPILHLHN